MAYTVLMITVTLFLTGPTVPPSSMRESPFPPVNGTQQMTIFHRRPVISQIYGRTFRSLIRRASNRFQLPDRQETQRPPPRAGQEVRPSCRGPRRKIPHHRQQAAPGKIQSQVRHPKHRRRRLKRLRKRRPPRRRANLSHKRQSTPRAAPGLRLPSPPPSRRCRRRRRRRRRPVLACRLQ